MGRSRAAGHASTREGIDVGIRCSEAIRERLQEGNELVLLRIGQTEPSGRHVYIVRDLGHRPAVDLLDCSRRAMSGSDGERIHVARIVEMHELLQAFDVAVVKELLLEIRYQLSL